MPVKRKANAWAKHVKSIFVQLRKKDRNAQLSDAIIHAKRCWDYVHHKPTSKAGPCSVLKRRTKRSAATKRRAAH